MGMIIDHLPWEHRARLYTDYASRAQELAAKAPTTELKTAYLVVADRWVGLAEEVRRFSVAHAGEAAPTAALIPQKNI